MQLFFHSVFEAQFFRELKLELFKNMKYYPKSSIISACLGKLSCIWLLYKSKIAVELAMAQETDAIQISFGILGYIPLFFALIGLVLAVSGFQKKQDYSFIGFTLNGILFLFFYPFLLAISYPVIT